MRNLRITYRRDYRTVTIEKFMPYELRDHLNPTKASLKRLVRFIDRYCIGKRRSNGWIAEGRL